MIGGKSMRYRRSALSEARRVVWNSGRKRKSGCDLGASRNHLDRSMPTGMRPVIPKRSMWFMPVRNSADSNERTYANILNFVNTSEGIFIPSST
ncbi:hypothetical protein PGT21_005224 [Puccinia graminis f. sp. tritici]|uniref:Uncharacterized protein n=1 Tax=Puccinia graminis f. sp. tritici TaxID=56615 RepID=A0A5B0MMZ6_PUCGR|nr:hypothetical protein PGT21_005224 [Puccinia graminis f. sp. tritici]